MKKLDKKKRYRRKRNPVMKQAATKAKIRVQLDSRTFITLPEMSALKLWKERYPEAKVIV